jgi:hypothetical protein
MFRTGSPECLKIKIIFRFRTASPQMELEGIQNEVKLIG